MVMNVGSMYVDEIEYSFHFYPSFKAFKMWWYLISPNTQYVIVSPLPKPPKHDKTFKHATISENKMNIEN